MLNVRDFANSHLATILFLFYKLPKADFVRHDVACQGVAAFMPSRKGNESER